MSSNDWKKTAGQINSATGQNSHDPEIQYYKNEADAFSGKTNLNVPDLGMQPVSGTFLERVAFFGDRVFIVFGFVVCAIFALRAYDNTLVLIQLMLLALVGGLLIWLVPNYLPSLKFSAKTVLFMSIGLWLVRLEILRQESFILSDRIDYGVYLWARSSIWQDFAFFLFILLIAIPRTRVLTLIASVPFVLVAYFGLGWGFSLPGSYPLKEGSFLTERYVCEPSSWIPKCKRR